MSIPESQLELWTHQGAEQSSANTYQSIKNCVENSEILTLKNFDIYLQGSYKNTTNIRGDSDVDIVVQLNSTFQGGLNLLKEEEKQNFKKAYNDSTYSFEEFKRDVYNTLLSHYGQNLVSIGKYSIKLDGGSGRLPSDVVACLNYRRYHTFVSITDHTYEDGIYLYTSTDKRKITNYPKIHYSNGVSKNDDTNGLYKPAIRMFKNTRSYIEDHDLFLDKLAPSYFVECLLYNVPSNLYRSSLQSTFTDSIDWLNQNDISVFLCQNRIQFLFGDTPEQWNVDAARKFISKLYDLWNNWS